MHDARELAAVIAVILGFLKGVSLRAWLTLAAAVAVVVVVLFLRSHWIDVGSDRVQARWDAAEGRHAAAAQKQAEAARKLEERLRADYAAAVTRMHKENADALAERDALLADAAAGRVRLRDKFRCPAASVPGAPARPGGSADARVGVLSVEDQGFLVRIGAEADALARRLTACQAIVAADRN